MPSSADPIKDLLSAVATLTDEVTGLKREVVDLQTQVKETKEIVEAWGAVKTAGKFIKWFGGIVGAISAIIVGVKLGLNHVLGK